jgi:hypothetical protein
MRNLIVLLCVAAVLFAALTPAASGLLYALLVPFWFLVAVIVTFRFRDIQKVCCPLAALPALATSRAPPAV